MKNLTAFAIFFLSNFSNAQSIAGKTRIDSNTIAFRWAPTEYADYKIGSEKGFRFLIRNKTNSDLRTDTLIKPWHKNDTRWAENEKKDKRFFAIYDFIYDTNREANSKNEKNSIQMYYGLLLLMCDTDSLIAQAMGLYYVSDTTRRSENEYSIHVESIPQKKLIFPDPQIASENPVEKITLQCRRKSAVLSWETKNVISNYSSYSIERSINNSGFVKINTAPVVELFTGKSENHHVLFYYDTISKENQKYIYRIRGITHFGTYGPPSEMCSCYLFPELSGTPEIDTILATASGLKIRRKTISEADFLLIEKGFVTKSINQNSSPVYLYEVNQNSGFQFIDSFPDRINYYVLNTVHRNGDTLKSFAKCFIVPDTIAPVPPSEIYGHIKNDGNVEISWENIDEQQPVGYRVFRRHSHREDWQEQSTTLLKEPFFCQKLNLQTLDSTLEYSVTASDTYFNCSRYSAPISLKIPDIIPPPKAVFTKIQNQKGKIILNWNYPETEAVLNCALFRIQKQSQMNILQFSKNTPLTSFNDTTKMNDPVQYCIRCHDAAGNVSVSDTIIITPIPIEDPLKIELTGTADRINHAVCLLWKINSSQALKIQVYKSDQSGNFYPVQSLQGITAFYRDKNVRPGNTYCYKLGVELNTGRWYYSGEIKVIY